MARSPDEKKLVRRILEGDAEAFRPLVRTYQSPVYHLALRILRNRDDAEDAAQDVFVKVFRKLRSYDDRYALKSWILRITHNHCIDQLRKRKHKMLSLDEPFARGDGETEWELPDPDAVDPLEAALDSELKAILASAIERLSPNLQAAITLRHVEGLRYDEIADVLGIPLGTVKVRIFRAREELARLLGSRLGRNKTRGKEKPDSGGSRK
ncbi:MAG: sigma-70 family RNA polymerase sigma factor [Gemmatimonadetes bacterium]|nr:sigma-70 family RNA polymerase sigma factor [Gemmatimonadota bacterium]